MSAETLREAARLMRERAATCQKYIDHGHDWWEEMGLLDVFEAAGGDDEIIPGIGADAEYLAAMRPAFGLAVATWLDACALVEEVAPSKTKALALAVARAYLGVTP